MPNFNSVFKEEVRRIARKELKNSAGQLKTELVKLKKTVSEQKRRIDDLERHNRRLVRQAENRREREVKPEENEVDRARVSASHIRRLREKLGLTQAELAELLGVSGQSVWQWEQKEGPLRLRRATKAAVVEARKMGVREARRRLEQPA